MAKFSGVVGFGISTEIAPDVWDDVITEKMCYGDVIRDNKVTQEADKVNDDVSVSNQISIVANNYAISNFRFIRYVRWEGVLWTVTNVEVRRPRLILSIGSVYNGPRPE